MNKKVLTLFLAIASLGLVSCNSNDDETGIVIEGIDLTKDVDCCSAEEALQVYKFIQTVRIIPELSTTVDDKYDVWAYSKTGTLHKGYNDLYFVVTKKKTGNYVKFFDIKNITPLMHMGSKGGVQKQAIKVDALPDGQDWLKNFKIGDDTYFLSLVNPSDWKTGKNTIQAYVSKKSNPITTPYALATETFTIEIDPRMPDMGNHTSPDNTPLVKQKDGSYTGNINLTMTGLWRIHLTVRDAEGNIVAGGDDLKDGFSSLYWDVTL